MAKMTRAEFANIFLSSIEKNPTKLKSEAELEEEVEQRCRAILQEQRHKDEERDRTLRIIPRLFVKKDATCNEISEIVKQEARMRMLKRQETILLEQEELNHIYDLLLQFSRPDTIEEISPTSPESDLGKYKTDRARINYDGFCQVRAHLSEKVDYYFKPSVFLQFPRDKLGCISIARFYDYILCRDALLRKRISLAWHDSAGSGFLTEQELENWIQEEIATSPILSKLEKSYQAFYICHAARRFLFLFDSSQRHKVRIRELIKSPVLDELLILRQELTEEELQGNWFAPATAREVYEMYTKLDLDHNGLLSQEELLRYRGSYLTEAFVQRVFEESQTFNGYIDFKAFLDFVLAMEDKGSKSALHYFFRILDLRKQGAIGIFEINYFFRDVRKHLIKDDLPAPSVEDVTDEIFDMVKPKQAHAITLDDLVNSNVGDTVVSILTDIEAFYHYDNRESLIAQQAREEHA